MKRLLSGHMSLQFRLILMFWALTITPLIILVFAVYFLLSTSINIGVNQQLEKALNAALSIADKSYSENQNRISFQTVSLSYEPGLREAEQLPFAAPILEDALKTNDFDAIELYDANGQLLHFVTRAGYQDLIPLTDPERITANLQSNFDLITRSGPENRILKTGKAIENDRGQIIGMLVGNKVFPEEYVTNLNIIEENQRFYKQVDLKRRSYLFAMFGAFITLALLMAIVAVFVAVYFARRFTEPIGELVTGTRELAMGNIGYQLPQQREDEIGDLMKAFNQMSQDLAEHRQKLIHAERIAAWQGIARRLAHEIKNPLTPIQLSIQHLRDEYKKSDNDFEQTFTECTDTIIQEVDAIRTMVQEFSEFARMPAPNFQEMDLKPVLRELVSFFATARPNMHFSLEMENGLPKIEADSERLRRVIINLIENAIHAVKHKREKVVRVAAMPRNDTQIEVVFEDNGHGIPADHLESIFQPYFTTKENGTGLGLAIVDRIIRDHNGQIQVQSTVGQGTTFSLILLRHQPENTGQMLMQNEV